ncbi:MAG: bifunctional folylpolyglutamate synthase/dihydrofolate synthase [Acholeplasmataceae bacterium]
MTLKDKITWLESLKRFKNKTSLDHLSSIFKDLKLNHSATKIQVIGTNGKGSTAKMLTDIVKQSKTVGTFMSPYVYTFHERILIQGEPISNDVLEQALDYIIDVRKKYDSLTFFECLTLMAFYVFKKLNLEIIIMEAGIGGRLDSTSIETYDMTLFTSVGHDHLNILGPTLRDVCIDKVQALKRHGVLISAVSNAFDDIITHHVKQTDATWIKVTDASRKVISHYPLTFLYDDEVYTLQYTGDHYATNALLAIEAAKRMHIQPIQIKHGLLSSILYGRFERCHDVILDAAHNVESIDALAKTIEKVYPYQGIFILLSALGDKDIIQMIQQLDTIATVIVTSFDDPRYIDLSYVKDKGYIFIENFNDAYQYVRNIKDVDAQIIITGSIHFISQAKRKILNTF